MTLKFANAILIAAMVLISQNAQASIVVHGSTTAYQETGGDWLTMGTNDIDGSGGLGSDGFVFYDASVAAGDYEALPSYVTAHSTAAELISRVGYGSIDSPILLDNTDELSGISVGTGGAAGTDNTLSTFTVAGLVPSQTVRVGVLGGVENTGDGRWDSTSFTLTSGALSATVGDHTLSPLAVNPGGTNTGWVFFDIDADGIYTLSGTKRAANQGSAVSGLTFDSVTTVPEPSSLALLGLAAIGIVARRRK